MRKFSPRLRHLPELTLLWSLFAVPLYESLGAQDCNVNEIEDLDDIRVGISEDCNSDGVPDECELVPLALGSTGDLLLLSVGPGAAASGDFNRDGLDDLAVGSGAISGGARVMVFLSDGNGTFRPEVGYPVGAGSRSIRAADIDRDGDLDIVTVESDAVVILANQGDGTFVAPIELPVPLTTRELELADVTGDGFVDIVTTNRRSSSVTWIANPNGINPQIGGSFEVAADPIALATADFDGDGRVDIAVASDDELRASVLIQNDSHSFEEATSLAEGRRQGSLAVADFDHDGTADLGVGSLEALSLWLNPGDGRFAMATTYAVAAHTLLIDDLDDDGNDDVLAGAIDFTTVRLLRGRGDGSLHPPQALSLQFRAFTGGDFDGDGDVDLAFANTSPNAVTLLWNGQAGLTGFAQEILDSIDRPHGIAVGDFNTDGFSDVITSNSFHSTFTMFPGNGDGTFGELVLRSLGETLSAVVSADLDNNGTDDVVFRGPSGLRVFLDPGATDFSDGSIYPSRGDFQFLATADVDGDGSTDVLAPLTQQRILTVHFNDGRGGLAERQDLVLSAGPRAARGGDLDGDGDADLVTANRNASSVSIIFQVAPKEFAPATTIPIVGRPHDLQVRDFNQDGRLDIVTANQESQDLTVFLNAGAGRFEDVRRYPIGRIPFGLAAADLTGDGLLDLVTTNEESHSISLLRGRTDGSFGPPQSFRVGSGPRFTVAMDVDDDGDLDLAVANRRSAEVSMILNHLKTPGARVDFLESVCTELDFDRITAFGIAPRSMERTTHFLLPVSDAPSPVPQIYGNAGRFQKPEDLLRTTFPTVFPDLDRARYLELVARRSSRQFIAGTLSLLSTNTGPAYGADFVVDSSPEESLTLAEVRVALEALGQSFLLEPLVYAPATQTAREAAAEWIDPGFTVLVIDEAPDPPEVPLGTPTFALEVPPETTVCGVFVEGSADRGPREERLAKSTLRLRAGRIELPTTDETFPADLFEELVFGPDREVAAPQGTGRFRVQRLQGPDNAAVFRFLYAQTFLLLSGGVLELEIVAPLEFRAPNSPTERDEPIREVRSLPREYFVTLNGQEPLQATLDGTPFVHYGSCSYEELSVWSVEATLTDGTELSLTERFDEAESELVTAPAAILRAEIAFPSVRRVVTDYFDLVYSALRHNQPADYWVVLDPPVEVDNVGEVHAVELKAPTERLRPVGSAAYLGADFEVLAIRELREFRRQELDRARFLRGDVDADGHLTVRDPIVLVEALFRRGPLGCRKSADADDDGRVNLVDAIAVVTQLFGQRQPLPVPFPTCGEDPTPDALDCRDLPSC